MVLGKIEMKMVELFNIEIEKKIKIHNNYCSRKATEEEYFVAYLHFLSNSTYYSRFKYLNERTQKNISGKTLNNKVNKWISLGIFKNIFNSISNAYCVNIQPETLKYISGDTLFVPNRICNKKEVGMCVYYKSKYGIKINTTVDTLGTPIDISIAKGNEHDAIIAIDRLSIVAEKIEAEKYKNDDKLNRISLNDGIYDSQKFKDESEKNHITPIVVPNMRNIKNLEKKEAKKLTPEKTKIIKKRHIVENCFSWLTQYSPRFYRVFSRKSNNFLNEVYICATKIILSKMR